MTEQTVVVSIRGVDYTLTVREAERALLDLQAGLYDAVSGEGA